MNKEKCYLIKDLLPLYVDELCNEETGKIIKDHLEECPDCRKTYNSMKGEIEGEDEIKYTADYDKELLEKVGKDVKKKTEKSRYTAIASVACIILFFILISIPVIPIGKNDLSARVVNPEFTVVSEWKKYNEIPEKSVMLFDDSKKMEDCYFSRVVFGDEYAGLKELEDIVIYADKDYDLDKISIVEFDSRKNIGRYKTSVKYSDGENVMLAKGFKTSILGSLNRKSVSRVTVLEFEEIDKVCIKKGNSYIRIDR